MKAILKFNLPEDKNKLIWAQRGESYYSVLRELDQNLRGYLKYNHKFGDVREALEHIRDFINNSVDFDEVE